MMAASKVLYAILAPHAEALERIGLDVRYASYALIYFRHHPDGSMDDFIARAAAENAALDQQRRKLERQVGVLQRLTEPPPQN